MTDNALSSILEDVVIQRNVAQKELALLRLSLRRVGELAKQNGADSLVIPDDGAERGWNRLCAGIADFIDVMGNR